MKALFYILIKKLSFKLCPVRSGRKNPRDVHEEMVCKILSLYCHQF